MPVWNTSSIINETKTNPAKRGRTDDDMDGTTDTTTRQMTLEDLLKIMNEQFKQTQEQIKEVNTTISQKIDSVKAELDDKLCAVSRDIASFKEECETKFKLNEGNLCELGERVDTIKEEIGGLENRNELIVSGVPYLQGENLAVYFQAMWKQVGLNESQLPTIDARRLNTSNSNERHGLILLQFALKNNRDDFYSCYLKKCDLRLSHLGIDSPRRIYVNESLTVSARKIKAAALQMKKAGKLSAVYTKLGTVLVKRPEDQQAVAIRSENQLNQFS